MAERDGWLDDCIQLVSQFDGSERDRFAVSERDQFTVRAEVENGAIHA
ncbi:hypothetical protein [Gulosibacter sp. ACHW.36C]|uniref:Uncharacterized protein n=1 Tax=Gulosibacter sediminis TaxID=1729695 RepID=A0ABY4MXY4_9MICO|nr:hypothetical protein [Gulosibacter sediminis]UQN14575.1 hypothetical protein M3M28_11060 [Gulosibacter sediminis]